MNEYSLFDTNAINNDDSNANNNNNNNNDENYDVGTVDLQSSISVDFDVSSANENTNIENINNIIDTSNLINALNNIHPYNSGNHSYYQSNSTSNTNLSHQNLYNAQLNLDSLDQCIQIQAEPFKFASVSYSATQPTSNSWRNTPTYTIPAVFDETIPLGSDVDLQSNQNQTNNNYFCMSNNFNSG